MNSQRHADNELHSSVANSKDTLLTNKFGPGHDPNASLTYNPNKAFSLQEAYLATGGFGKSIIRPDAFYHQYDPFLSPSELFSLGRF
jgi:hypothetical protein